MSVGDVPVRGTRPAPARAYAARAGACAARERDRAVRELRAATRPARAAQALEYLCGEGPAEAAADTGVPVRAPLAEVAGAPARSVPAAPAFSGGADVRPGVHQAAVSSS